MLRVISAASGEELLALGATESDSVAEHGATVGALKRYLARHFEWKHSRFQMKLLREGHPEELEDDESILLPMDLQLLLRNYLPRDEESLLTFHRNCAEGLVDEVERALKDMQDPNACSSGPPDYDSNAPLHQASLNGHVEVLRVLLDAGADKEATNAWGSRPLHMAAGEGHLEALRLLLKARADMAAESEHGQALHAAAFGGHVDVVRLLVESGADREGVTSAGHSFSPPNDSPGGLRPVHMAVGEGHVEVVRLLLAAGAEADKEDSEGFRPLHEAAQQGYVEIVSLLLEFLANQEAEDQEGHRPLHLAVLGSNLEVVRLLLDKAADSNARTHEGHTPYELAVVYHEDAVVQLLREAVEKRVP